MDSAPNQHHFSTHVQAANTHLHGWRSENDAQDFSSHVSTKRPGGDQVDSESDPLNKRQKTNPSEQVQEFLGGGERVSSRDESSPDQRRRRLQLRNVNDMSVVEVSTSPSETGSVSRDERDGSRGGNITEKDLTTAREVLQPAKKGAMFTDDKQKKTCVNCNVSRPAYWFLSNGTINLTQKCVACKAIQSILTRNSGISRLSDQAKLNSFNREAENYLKAWANWVEKQWFWPVSEDTYNWLLQHLKDEFAQIEAESAITTAPNRQTSVRASQNLTASAKAATTGKGSGGQRQADHSTSIQKGNTGTKSDEIRQNRSLKKSNPGQNRNVNQAGPTRTKPSGSNPQSVAQDAVRDYAHYSLEELVAEFSDWLGPIYRARGTMLTDPAFNRIMASALDGLNPYRAYSQSYENMLKMLEKRPG